jgi:signal transduction histidine kinase
LRVLIAEDDAPLRETLADLDETRAAVGATEEPYDLAIVDVWLGGSRQRSDDGEAADAPEPNGFEAVRWVREACPKCRVVMISGDEDLVPIRAGEDVEFHSFRRKPIAAGELRYVAFQDTEPRTWSGWLSAERRMARIIAERALANPDPAIVPYEPMLDRIVALANVRGVAFVEYAPETGLGRAVSVRGEIRQEAFEETTANLARSVIGQVVASEEPRVGLAWLQSWDDAELSRVCDAQRVIVVAIWTTGPRKFVLVVFDEVGEASPRALGTLLREAAGLVEPMARWWLVAQRQADDAAIRVGLYYGVFSHELRNPLSTLIDLAQLSDVGHEKVRVLAEQLEETAAALYAGTNMRRALSARNLAEELRREVVSVQRKGDLFRAEVRTAWDVVERYRELFAKPRPELMDLNTIVEELRPMVSHRLRRAPDPRINALEFHVLPSGEPLRVFAARVHVLQVVLNLVDNAVEWARPVHGASHGGEVRGAVWIAGARDAADGSACVDVGNSGYGLGAPASRIFEPGFTLKRDGCGLGLAIVRDIVERDLGGRIAITANQNPGDTVFRMALPPR